MLLDQARVQLLGFIVPKDSCLALLLVAVQVLLSALDAAQTPSILLYAMLP